jgi:hypothetical protein
MTTTQTKNGSAQTRTVAHSPQEFEAKIAELEAKIAFLDWMREEQRQQIQRLAVTLASVLAQMAQPQIQQNIVANLLGP